jgi:hypothetical protein
VKTKKEPVATVDPEDCPQCDYRLSTVWTTGRMLKKMCGRENCWGYDGAPYPPPKKPIRIRRMVAVDAGGGWHYEMFDQYGHVYIDSRSFRSAAAAEQDARRQMPDSSGVMGRVTVVIWPPRVEVRAHKIIKAPAPRKPKRVRRKS